MRANYHSDHYTAREGYIPADHAELFYREIGTGQPIVVLHGGPDFDHRYFLPELDGLSDTFRLIYYDQRGRGSSAKRVEPDDVDIRSEVADLDAVREYLRLDTLALLGHSWGAVLAMEFALNYPSRVSRMILMNPAPASRGDYLVLRQHRLDQSATDLEKLRAMALTPGYQEGDPDSVADYYRIHFRAALRHPEQLDKVIERLRASFTKIGILKARAIEERLMAETFFSDDYDLLPQLEQLSAATLVLHGDADLIPVQCARSIAEAIPTARLTVLAECGHFSFLERPDEVRKEMTAFFRDA